LSADDLSGFSMHDLFRQEAETQTAVLTDGLLALERTPADPGHLEALMRAAHSLKGAARIVGLEAAVRVSHVMEDCFVAAQEGKLTLDRTRTNPLLRGVDLLTRIAHTPESAAAEWEQENAPEIENFVNALASMLRGEPVAPLPVPPPAEPAPAVEEPPPPAPPTAKEAQDRVLRVTAESLNRLLGLAGEALVESRWLPSYAGTLLRIRRRQGRLVNLLETLRESLDERQRAQLEEARREAMACAESLANSHEELETFVRRSANLSRRLYREAQISRMRPFADRAQGFPRFVRDLAASLGKEARLDLLGASTQVDRDILEKLEAPLTHLLRNAIDHGLESPEERRRAGKPPEGLLTLEARHSAGMLAVILSDDGRGIDLENLREAIVRKHLTTHETAAKMSEEELLEFLFLPGFSTRDNVTELSGRGVGLDVVRSMVREVRGAVRLTSQTGRGTRCHLQLPLTLSVLRALLVEIGGEPYALPLSRIARTLKLPRDRIELLEGQQHFTHDGQSIGLVSAHQVFELDPPTAPGEELPVVVLGEHGRRHGLAVERFLGEHELVVQPLDPRLGKLKNISAGAILADRAPVLIVDMDDLLRSVELLAAGGRLGKVWADARGNGARRRRRVLVVDDSLTVRELERKLLGSQGYEVEVAVDGVDAWNALRAKDYDLVISDVDMPRMDGIELIALLKKDARLRSIPVMIVSYKDREEDRQRGLDAGADYYLTKSSFHDASLLQAVEDLIGEAQE
jgi:two-component system sensor histidine kinase and response regulator WspE